jgi:hypothetical protein
LLNGKKNRIKGLIEEYPKFKLRCVIDDKISQKVKNRIFQDMIIQKNSGKIR